MFRSRNTLMVAAMGLMWFVTGCGSGASDTGENVSSNQYGSEESSRSVSWSSEQAYVDDMLDSYEKLNNIETDMIEVMDGYEAGYYSGEEASELADDYREAVVTHIDYFTDTTPPEGFEQFQADMLDAWNLYEEGLYAYSDGFYYDSLEDFGSAQQVMQQGVNAENDAVESMPEEYQQRFDNSFGY